MRLEYRFYTEKTKVRILTWQSMQNWFLSIKSVSGVIKFSLNLP